MYDARPYTDYINIEIYENSTQNRKIVEIPIVVGQIEIPLFIPALKATKTPFFGRLALL